jgi:hypothetical protein
VPPVISKGADSGKRVTFVWRGQQLQITRSDNGSAGAIGSSFKVVCVRQLQALISSFPNFPTSNVSVAVGYGRWARAHSAVDVVLSRVLSSAPDICLIKTAGVIGYFNNAALGLVQETQNSTPATPASAFSEQLLRSAAIGARGAVKDGHFPPVDVLIATILRLRPTLLGVKAVATTADVTVINIPYIIETASTSTSTEIALEDGSGQILITRVSAGP